jgi:hypothetical protein
MHLAPLPVAVVRVRNVYRAEARSRSGELLWVEEVPNLVTDQGLDYLLDVAFKAGSAIASWYVGLASSSPTFAEADVFGGAPSHGGWTEVTGFVGSDRPALTLGAIGDATPDGRKVDNVASKAVFTASGSITVGGIFVASSEPKSNETGKLYGGAAFSTNRSLLLDYTLTVTVTLSVDTA